MSEPTSIKAKVHIPGKKSTYFQKPLTFDAICDLIRRQKLDEYTTNGLIEMAAKYPTQAYPSFRRNFNLMIQRVREQRRKDLDGEAQTDSEVQGPETPGPDVTCEIGECDQQQSVIAESEPASDCYSTESGDT